MAIAELKPIAYHQVELTLKGTSPLIQHRFPEKARKQIRDKKLGKKTKERGILDAEKEYQEAMHLTENGEYGIPVTAIKASMINAAHKDIGIEKTLVKKSIYIPCDDANDVIPIQCEEPIMREDWVRVGTGTDLRYRPEFRKWSCNVTIIYNSDNLQPTDIVRLLNLAGFGAGLLENRPEKGGDNGRFEVDVKSPVTVSVWRSDKDVQISDTTKEVA